MKHFDAEYTDFRDHDPRIEYFMKGAPTRNFGDFLSEILPKEFMLHPRIEADVYRLVGSVIEPTYILRDLRHKIGLQSGHVAFWCCGMRTHVPSIQKLKPCAHSLAHAGRSRVMCSNCLIIPSSATQDYWLPFFTRLRKRR